MILQFRDFIKCLLGGDYNTSFVPGLVIFTSVECIVLIIIQNLLIIMLSFFLPHVVSHMF